MLKQTSIHFFIDPTQNHKTPIQADIPYSPLRLQIIQHLAPNSSLEFRTRKIFVVEHSAWRQMKENYQIYLPY